MELRPLTLRLRVILRRQQYVGKVRFSYFDAHVQGTKKVLLATENNVFAALNTRTGDLCEYPVLHLFVVRLPPQNIQLKRHIVISLLLLLFSQHLKCLSLATCGQGWARGQHRYSDATWTRWLRDWVWSGRYFSAVVNCYNYIVL